MSEEMSVEQGRVDKLSYTVQRDWCDLMPITHGAARMHRILRSMMTENKTAPPSPTRRLTVDRLCWIMSMITNKPVGEQTIRDYRKELLDNGMIDVLPGRSPNDPPRYVVHDLPPDGWSGFCNAWKIDDAYTPGWRADMKRRSATQRNNGQITPRISRGSSAYQGKSPHGFSEGTDFKGVPHGFSGGIHGSPGGTQAVTRADAPLSNSSKEPSNQSSSSSSSVGPEAGMRDEEEKQTPSAEQATLTDSVIMGIQWPAGFKSPRGANLKKLRDAVSGALARGWCAEDLLDAVNTDLHWKGDVKSPVAVVVSVVEKHAPYASEARSVTEEALDHLKRQIDAQRAAVSACDGCDETGWTSEGWHGHGDKNLVRRLRELENPDQVAMNKSLNSKNFHVA